MYRFTVMKKVTLDKLGLSKKNLKTVFSRDTVIEMRPKQCRDGCSASVKSPYVSSIVLHIVSL